MGEGKWTHARKAKRKVQKAQLDSWAKQFFLEEEDDNGRSQDKKHS